MTPALLEREPAKTDALELLEELLGDDLDAVLAEATPTELERLVQLARAIKRGEWKDVARPNQLPPPGDWRVWIILAGRGWGKTRTGAEWAAQKARDHPHCRIALVAQTFADGRDTMVEGESGLLSVLAESELRGGSQDTAWNRSIGELYLANGSRFRIFSSERPKRLRGPQHHFGWGDEPATWEDADEGPSQDTTWSNFDIGCRLTIEGPDGMSEPQILVTGTPRPVKLLTDRDHDPPGLLLRDDIVVTRGHTDENLENLAASYREAVIEPLRGTRLGRQELAAELLEDVPGALWTGELLDQTRVWQLPPKGLTRKVLALDPSDGTEKGARQGMVAVGLGLDRHLYVLHAEGLRVKPWDFLWRAVDVALELDAVIVVEKNHGGAYLVELLEQVLAYRGLVVPYVTVDAGGTRGQHPDAKLQRAEPVAALYEQHKAHHWGRFVDLEEEQTTYTGEKIRGRRKPKSPDLMDALVHGMRHLMRGALASPRSDAGVRKFEEPPDGVTIARKARPPGVRRF